MTVTKVHNRFTKTYNIDTLALAEHKTGDTKRAIDTQKRAIDFLHLDHADFFPAFWKNLEKYEATLIATK